MTTRKITLDQIKPGMHLRYDRSGVQHRARVRRPIPSGFIALYDPRETRHTFAPDQEFLLLNAQDFPLVVLEEGQMGHGTLPNGFIASRGSRDAMKPFGSMSVHGYVQRLNGELVVQELDAAGFHTGSFYRAHELSEWTSLYSPGDSQPVSPPAQPEESDAGPWDALMTIPEGVIFSVFHSACFYRRVGSAIEYFDPYSTQWRPVLHVASRSEQISKYTARRVDFDALRNG